MQVFDRLIKVGMFKDPNHNITVATKAVAYLMRLMFMVYDKLHVISAANCTGCLLLENFKMLMSKLVASAKQVIISVGFCPSPLTFGSSEYHSRRFGRSFGRPLGNLTRRVRLAFFTRVVAVLCRFTSWIGRVSVWHGPSLQGSF